MSEPSGHAAAVIDNTGIWLDAAQRPRDYNELDWVNARSLLQPVVELGQPAETDTYVDIGTGTGAVLRHVAPFVGRAIGVDISPAMLGRVDTKGYGNISLHQADMRGRTSFPDGFADLVTTRMMLHDLTDPKAAIAETWRLVRSGGRLVASEYVTDICLPQAVQQTDAFENGERDSSLINDALFSSPSPELVEFHRGLFALKNEPDRFLWTAEEFRHLFAVVCYGGNVSMQRSMTPFNSVNNWLGKSGFGLGVKQNGILSCMELAPELRNELGLVITANGQPIEPSELPELAATYRRAGKDGREAMQVDAKIHRVFANVVVQR
jgi:SAM-dependent methyltransferase